MLPIEEMRIYILNTTRFYHEDFEEYPGAWFSCPVDFEEVRERLGVQNEEEIEIEDYELPFPLEGSTRLWEINALCRIVQEMQGTPLYYEMDVIQKRWFHSFTEFIDNKCRLPRYLTKPRQRRSEWDMAGSDGISRVSAVLEENRY